MARHISEEVSDMVTGSNAGGIQKLVLVVEDGELHTIEARAEEHDVGIDAIIEPNIVVVEIATEKIEEFCRPSYILSVSQDEGLEVLDSGNLSPPRV